MLMTLIANMVSDKKKFEVKDFMPFLDDEPDEGPGWEVLLEKVKVISALYAGFPDQGDE